MKIEEWKGIAVVKDGSREYFGQEDVVEIVGSDNGEKRTIKGRIDDVIPRGYETMVRIDTSERYRKSYIDIPEHCIISIRKIPD